MGRAAFGRLTVVITSLIALGVGAAVAATPAYAHG